jgi:hypothetical protein
MIFVGDAIFPGGDDYPVKQVGVDSIRVRDPDETKGAVEAICAWLESKQAFKPPPARHQIGRAAAHAAFHAKFRGAMQPVKTQVASDGSRVA